MVYLNGMTSHYREKTPRIVSCLEPYITEQENLERHKVIFDFFLSDDILFETKHINDSIMYVTDSLTILLVRLLNHYKITKKMNIYEPIYTGWNFTSKEDRDPRNYSSVDEIPHEFIYSNDEKLYHPIFFSFDPRQFKDIEDVFAGSGSRGEKITKYMSDVIKARLKNDEIVIFINLDQAEKLDLNNEEEINVIKSIIGHELLHCFERFIMRYDDVLEHAKNSLYQDFIKNKFNIKKPEYGILDHLFYFITPEEQRARFNQLALFLKKYEWTSAPKFNVNLTTHRMVLTRLNSDNSQETRRHIGICAVLKQKKVNDITNLSNFYYTVADIANVNNHKPVIYLIIGYYLLMHKSLNFKQLNIRHYMSKDLFSEKNINYMLKNENPNFPLEFMPLIYKCIIDNIVNYYLDYEKKIYELVDDRIENIFPDINFERKYQIKKQKDGLLSLEDINSFYQNNNDENNKE